MTTAELVTRLRDLLAAFVRAGEARADGDVGYAEAVEDGIERDLRELVMELQGE